MMDQLLLASTVLAALGSGLIAGNFFAFSAYMMTALDRLPVPQGISAMQSITAAILSPVFLVAFLGTAALAGILGIAAPLRWSEPDAIYLLAGSLLYLNGPFGVTLLRNAPLNKTLAGLKPDSAEAKKQWKQFVPAWTAWNHVRWITSLAAAACFTMALVKQAS